MDDDNNPHVSKECSAISIKLVTCVDIGINHITRLHID